MEEGCQPSVTICSIFMAHAAHVQMASVYKRKNKKLQLNNQENYFTDHCEQP